MIIRFASFLFLIACILSCSSNEQSPTIVKTVASQVDTLTTDFPVYGWTGGPGESTDEELHKKFNDWKQNGVDGILLNGGQDPATYRRVGKIAKSLGLGFQAWIPTMVQQPKEGIQSAWYAINRKGESALDKPAYVDYYKFLCPNHEGVYQYLERLYLGIAEVKEVDGVHLDYIRFPDVILARGLWDKYGLVMDREYPSYDYCYGPKCVADFKDQSGIDILKVEDPSQVEEWKQFRYDLITSIVNRLSKKIKATGKTTSAAVFPGPHSVAKKIVRQEWNKWELDAFYPMLYNDFYLEKPSWVGEMTKEGVAALNNKAPLYSGLFICPDPTKKAQYKDPEHHGLLPEELEEAITSALQNGAKGICLFTPDRMTPAHWEVLREVLQLRIKN